MKIQCNREHLLQAFLSVASVAPSRSPKPILQHVKLEATHDGASLTATDLEIGIRHALAGVEVHAPGAVLLPVARFGGILREGTDASFLIEANPHATSVRGERSHFELASADPAEFPSHAESDRNESFSVSPRVLRELIRRTIFATDNESSRYALGGVKLEFDDSLLTAVGTDGRRLARMSGPVGKIGAPTAPTQNTIVPTKAMQLIERTIAASESEVLLDIKGSELLVRGEKASISARLLEGRYPDWRKVFPDSASRQRIDLAVGATLSAVRQAAIVTSEESRGLEFTFGDGMLLLSGRAAEVGQSRVDLPIGYDGPAIAIMLDPRYVIDFLKVLDPDKTCTIELKDSEAAAVFATDDGYGYVIMPLARER